MAQQLATQQAAAIKIQRAVRHYQFRKNLTRNRKKDRNSMMQKAMTIGKKFLIDPLKKGTRILVRAAGSTKIGHSIVGTLYNSGLSVQALSRLQWKKSGFHAYMATGYLISAITNMAMPGDVRAIDRGNSFALSSCYLKN